MLIVNRTDIKIKALCLTEMEGILKMTTREISIIPRKMESMQVFSGISIFFDVFKGVLNVAYRFSHFSFFLLICRAVKRSIIAPKKIEAIRGTP